MSAVAADFNLYQCNPGTLRSTRTTCLPQTMLERLRDEWNRRYPAAKIPATIKRKETLWAALRDRMRRQYECASEYCAVQKLAAPAERAAAAEFFRPPKPAEWLSRPREWHDTETIARVMEQYETAYPHFEFIGPVPIDFDERPEGSFGRCVVDELCGLDLRAMKARGDWAIGIVFNLDPHDRPGSHWVCAYLDLRAGAAYYYDSYGYPPPAEVRRLLRRCREQGCRQIYWNDIRHQRKETECGTYCMYVIIGLLKGRTFADICRRRVDDDTMNAIRDLLFATERPSSAALTAARRRLVRL
ncbi:hypothetical protein EBZ80_13595 [bacterium]|nr:hypothetical protein [bacterium]